MYSKMFGFPLLIIVVSALAATGITAIGLHLFFRFLEPQTAAQPIVAGESATSRE
jgi:hypothetical protein